MKQFFRVVAVVLFAGSVVHADFAKGSQTVSLLGGIGSSSSQYDYQPGTSEDVSGSGAAYGGQYLYYYSDSPSLAFGFDLVNSANGDSESDDLLAGLDTTARLKSVVGLAMARLSYPQGIFRPYLFGGLGLHRSRQTLSARPHTGGSWLGGGNEERRMIDEDTTSAALGGGIGIDVFPTESFFVGAEWRWTWLGSMDTDDTTALRAAGYNVHRENAVGQGNILFRTGLKF